MDLCSKMKENYFFRCYYILTCFPTSRHMFIKFLCITEFIKQKNQICTLYRRIIEIMFFTVTTARARNRTLKKKKFQMQYKYFSFIENKSQRCPMNSGSEALPGRFLRKHHVQINL